MLNMRQENFSSCLNRKEFIVLGGGIIGLSCALRLLEKYPNATLEVISEHFSPNTTSDVAAGLWGPYLLGSTPEVICRKWAQETHQYMHRLWMNGEAANCGICLMPVVELFTGEQDKPWWHDIVFGFQNLHKQPNQIEQEVESYAQQNYQSGISYITFTCEPTKLMKYYRDILTARNVRFRQARLDSIYSLVKLNINSTSIIINCLGLGAQAAACDTELRAIRGQVQKLEAKGIFHSIADDECYIIPNTETVTIGGTKQKSNNLCICPIDRYKIRKNCIAINPSLKNATVIKDVVALRPVRSTGVRLELEYTTIFSGPRGQHPSIVVHNYGHGGAGITLAWGCAGEVVRLIEQEIGRLESKL